MKIKSFLFILSLASLFACRDTAGHQHGHSHEAESAHVHDAKLYLVQYGQHTEFFAEADPLFVGSTSHFLIQLSRLEDFKPMDSVQIDLSLESGGKTWAATGFQRVKAGQYKLELQPGQIGSGQLLVRVRGLQRPDGVQEDQFRIPVQVYKDEHEAHHAAEHQTPSSSNAVVFTKAQSYLVDFKTEITHPENIGKLISSVAQILPTPGAQTEIIAKASGIVSLDKKNVVEGQAVSEGEYLFSIESGGMLENRKRRYA